MGSTRANGVSSSPRPKVKEPGTPMSKAGEDECSRSSQQQFVLPSPFGFIQTFNRLDDAHL
jgi:hypothetical protein